MTQKGTKTPSGIENRRRILDAAIDQVCEHGFSATSVSMVCEKAGITKPSLYWHFGNKAGLMGAVIEDITSRWIEEIQSGIFLEGTPTERRAGMLDSFREIVEERPDLLRILLVAVMERATVEPDIKKAVRDMTDATIEAIGSGFEATLGTSLPDMDLFGHTVVSLLEGALRRSLMEPDGYDLDRLFEDMGHTIDLLVIDRLKRSRS